jgi:hypothetical protein
LCGAYFNFKYNKGISLHGSRVPSSLAREGQGKGKKEARKGMKRNKENERNGE